MYMFIFVYLYTGMQTCAHVYTYFWVWHGCGSGAFNAFTPWLLANVSFRILLADRSLLTGLGLLILARRL